VRAISDDDDYILPRDTSPLHIYLLSLSLYIYIYIYSYIYIYIYIQYIYIRTGRDPRALQTPLNGTGHPAIVSHLDAPEPLLCKKKQVRVNPVYCIYMCIYIYIYIYI